MTKSSKSTYIALDPQSGILTEKPTLAEVVTELTAVLDRGGSLEDVRIVRAAPITFVQKAGISVVKQKRERRATSPAPAAPASEEVAQ